MEAVALEQFQRSDKQYKKLLANQKKTFKDQKLTDSTITCGDKTWKTHAADLCANRYFFNAAWGEDFQEAKTKTIDLSHDPPDAVEVLLEYLYTLTVPQLSTIKMAKEAWVIGDKYDLPGLRVKSLSILKTKLSKKLTPWKWDGQEDKLATLAMIDEIYDMTVIAGVEEVMGEILDSCCKSAIAASEDEAFQELLVRNREFNLAFVQALGGNLKVNGRKWVYVEDRKIKEDSKVKEERAAGARTTNGISSLLRADTWDTGPASANATDDDWGF